MSKKIFAALAIMLAIILQTASISAEQNVNIENTALNNQMGKEIQTTAPEVIEPITVIENYRVSTVCCGLAKYFAKIQVGIIPDPHKTFSITYFVPENGEWQSKAAEAFVIMNGQFLTADSIADTATDDSFPLYVAEKEQKNVFIIGRYEDNAQPGNNLDFMENITPETYKFITYIGIIFAKFQTSGFNPSINAAAVNVTLLGYSMGGMQSTLYLESDYNNAIGYVKKHIPVEIGIKLDPKKKKLIKRQRKHYEALKQTWNSGTFYNDEMLGMLYASGLAITDPFSPSPVVVGENNIRAWRELMSETYRFDNYTPTKDFRYLRGDKYRLYRVNEQRVLNASLTAVPYSALSIDIFLAGLEGNIPGYNIDASKIHTKTLCVGLGEGFGDQACYWFDKEVGKYAEVKSIIWGRDGHASWLFNEKAKRLWDKMIAWDMNN